jgi:hypothetical protein
MGERYAFGTDPCVAIGKYDRVVEIHLNSQKDKTISSALEFNPWTHGIFQGGGHDLDGNGRPSCCLTDDYYVVAVNEVAGQDNLQYRAGKVEKILHDYRIDWCGSTTSYDTGVTPSVSVNDAGDVVEVHKSENYDNLHYRAGKLDREACTISWGASHKYDTGENPSVAITGQYAVAVHKSQKSSNLYYNSGKIDPESQTIDWLAKDKYGNGVFPSVSMNKCRALVAVHRSQNNQKLYYQLGFYESDFGTYKIEWGKSKEYDKGDTPSVSLDCFGNLIEVHWAPNRTELFYNVGVMRLYGDMKKDPPQILWLK